MPSIVKVIDNPDAIRVAIEPTRRRILFLLNSQDMSASQIADILKKDVSTIYRHLHKLEEAGLIEPCRERVTRSIEEKVYRRTSAHFLFSSEAMQCMDEGAFTEYIASASNLILPLLEEMGYEIERDEECYQSFQRMILRWNEISAKGMDKIMDKERKISLPLYLFLMLTTSLIRFETDHELKRSCEVFLSKIKDGKRQGSPRVHSP